MMSPAAFFLWPLYSRVVLPCVHVEVEDEAPLIVAAGELRRGLREAAAARERGATTLRTRRRRERRVSRAERDLKKKKKSRTWPPSRCQPPSVADNRLSQCDFCAPAQT